MTLSLQSLLDLPQESVRTANECSGNGLFFAHGMLGLGEWRGVSWRTVLPLLADVRGGATHVEVVGFDEESRPSNPPHGFYQSYPGASWIFSLEDLDANDAMLALQLSGESLDLDHGAPVRLIVPGWYGCSHIKWLQGLRFCDRAEPPSAQMLEFAGRCNQPSPLPSLASEFLPATIPLSATVFQAELWTAGSGSAAVLLRGLLWGGGPGDWAAKLQSTSLRLRLDRERAVPLSMEAVGTADRWGWQPWLALWPTPRPGRYVLEMRCPGNRPHAWKINRGSFDRELVVETHGHWAALA